MKIICIDKFNRESIADELICNIENKRVGKFLVQLLNENEFEDSSNYYKLVDDDYELWKGMAELI